MSKFRKLVLFLISLGLSLVLVVTVFAHSGRTDSNGGHYDRSTGVYHYHNGGSNSGGSSNPTPTPTPTAVPTSTPIVAPTPTPTAAPTQQPYATPDTSKGDIETTGSITVFVDGEKVDFDQPPMIINGRVVIPVRKVVEELGCLVFWDSDERIIYVNYENIEIQKKVNSSNEIEIYVNNSIVYFDLQQPVVIDGRTLVPIRNVVEMLNCTVEWDELLKIVNIYSNKY